MRIITGLGIASGITIGKLQYIKHSSLGKERYLVTDIAAELGRVKQAQEIAVEQLDQLYEQALLDFGEKNAEIFHSHKMMLEDYDFFGSITDTIQSQKVNAEYAISVAAEQFEQIFASMESEEMKARAEDIRDISIRLQNALKFEVIKTTPLNELVIIGAYDLSPSDTVQLDRQKLLGLLTSAGSPNSHTAILARSLGIPAIIHLGNDLNEKLDGKNVIIDGTSGTVYVDPSNDVLAEMQRKMDEEKRDKERLQNLIGKKNRTLDGREVMLYANASCLEDVGAAITNDAGGIGLYRSESLYLERNSFPSEEELFTHYRQIVQNMGDKRTIIRTLDIGADKRADYFQLPNEENPALGMRAIRLCLTRKDIFITQLRALYRASAYGKIAIMFPMISAKHEVDQILEIVQTVQADLRSHQIQFAKSVEIGIMIETPAAAMISDTLAPLVDFFSIGTNDLTQYTLAIDRQNAELEPFYDAYHPAILRLIAMTVQNAHKAGIWVGICGELASDLSMLETFVNYSVDELSVSPRMILPLREKLRKLR